MLDIEHIGQRLSEMDATAKEVLGEDRRSDHRLFWQGLDVSSRNLERLYRLVAGAELEARIKALEDQGSGGDADTTQPAD